MIGTIANAAAIVVGSLLGLTLARGLPKHIVRVMEQGVALCVILIGLQMSVNTSNVLLSLLSLVIGGAIGSWIGIGHALERFGDAVQARLGQDGFSKGFVYATLLFCVGSMSILGAIESGLRGDHSILYLKAALDGITSLVLTTTLGFGVLFSAVSVLLYQGAIALAAGALESVLSIEMLDALRNVGGLLIISLGINMLFPNSVRTSDLLPALIVPVLYFLLAPLFLPM